MNDLVRRIELELLITEREGMIVENALREAKGNAIAYGEEAFFELSEKIRELIPTPLDKSDLHNLDLPETLIEKLYRNGIESVGQLAKCSEQDLLNLKRIGWQTSGQIMNALKNYALQKLKGE